MSSATSSTSLLEAQIKIKLKYIKASSEGVASLKALCANRHNVEAPTK